LGLKCGVTALGGGRQSVVTYSKLCFLPDPPVFEETLKITNRQGGIAERSINSVNKTIDSKSNIARTRAGS
jgi:hypothetical protein